MTLEEAIFVRKSRRSYLNKKIDEQVLAKLNKLIEHCNDKANLSIELIEDGSDAFNGLHRSYGMFKGVRTIIALKGNKKDKNLKEKLGFYGELLVLKAVSFDLGTCWVGGSFHKNNRLFDLSNDESLVCVITLGYTKPVLSFKEKLIRNSTHGHVKSPEYFYKSDTIPIPHWFSEGIKAVQKAPSAINRQKYTFYYNKGIVSAHTENSAMFDLVDLGIAKVHFSIICGGHFDWGNGGVYRPSLF
jgi:nitroreductase